MKKWSILLIGIVLCSFTVFGAGKIILNNMFLGSSVNSSVNTSSVWDMIYKNNLTVIDYILWVNSTNGAGSGEGDNTSFNQSLTDSLYYSNSNPSGYINSYIDTDTWNSSDDIWGVIDNGTFAKLPINSFSYSNYFNQTLNTTNNVTFNKVTTNHISGIYEDISIITSGTVFSSDYWCFFDSVQDLIPVPVDDVYYVEFTSGVQEGNIYFMDYYGDNDSWNNYDTFSVLDCIGDAPSNGDNFIVFSLPSTPNIDVDANLNISGTLTSSNFEGTCTGTNTGNQDLSNLIPYTGATKNVNIGSKDFNNTGNVFIGTVTTNGNGISIAPTVTYTPYIDFNQVWGSSTGRRWRFVSDAGGYYGRFQLLSSTTKTATPGIPALNFYSGTTGAIDIPYDNKHLRFGTGSDSSIYYDGTNMFINPKEVGIGQLTILGDLNISTSNGVGYIDTISYEPSTTAGLMAGNSPVGAYIDRGDVSEPDLNRSLITQDGNWYDWNISSIVPVGTKSVILNMYGYDNAAGTWIMFRKNGYTTNTNNIGGMVCPVANVFNLNQATIPVDENRIIEYRSASGRSWDDLRITIIGWFI